MVCNISQSENSRFQSIDQKIIEVSLIKIHILCIFIYIFVFNSLNYFVISFWNYNWQYPLTLVWDLVLFPHILFVPHVGPHLEKEITCAEPLTTHQTRPHTQLPCLGSRFSPSHRSCSCPLPLPVPRIQQISWWTSQSSHNPTALEHGRCNDAICLDVNIP